MSKKDTPEQIPYYEVIAKELRNMGYEPPFNERPEELPMRGRLAWQEVKELMYIRALKDDGAFSVKKAKNYAKRIVKTAEKLRDLLNGDQEFSRALNDHFAVREYFRNTSVKELSLAVSQFTSEIDSACFDNERWSVKSPHNYELRDQVPGIKERRAHAKILIGELVHIYQVASDSPAGRDNEHCRITEEHSSEFIQFAVNVCNALGVFNEQGKPVTERSIFDYLHPAKQVS